MASVFAENPHRFLHRVPQTESAFRADVFSQELREAHAIDQQAKEQMHDLCCAWCGFFTIGTTPPARCPTCGGSVWLYLDDPSRSVLDLMTRPLLPSLR